MEVLTERKFMVMLYNFV